MGEYVFSCACGYDARHSTKKGVLRDAERHSRNCSMTWDTDMQSIDVVFK